MVLDTLLKDIRRCSLCSSDLPLGPRPVLQASSKAKILVAGQAPGTKVHKSGKPFDDPSGDRLRDWMGMSKADFYDAAKLNIIPMGFCYPGRMPSDRGDAPPHPNCGATWHDTLFEHLPMIELKLIIGRYAIAYHLPEYAKLSVAAAIRKAQKTGYRDGVIVMPHPSPRNRLWLKNHPWFEADVVPEIRSRVQQLLETSTLT